MNGNFTNNHSSSGSCPSLVDSQTIDVEATEASVRQLEESLDSNEDCPEAVKPHLEIDNSQPTIYELNSLRDWLANASPIVKIAVFSISAIATISIVSTFLRLVVSLLVISVSALLFYLFYQFLIKIFQQRREFPQHQLLDDSKQISQEQSQVDLWDTISLLAKEIEALPENQESLDIQETKNQVIDSLDENIADFEENWRNLELLVQEQEQELLIQHQIVEKLQQKLDLTKISSDRHRLQQQLLQEKEKDRMLSKTLVGQRRNLKKRKKILSQKLT